MRQSLTISLAALAAALAAVACGGSKQSRSTDSQTAATTGAAPASERDPDVAQAGTGLPAGYQGRVDRPSMKLTDASYTVSGNRWEVRTGPAHIIWAPRDTASGSYAASATFEQLEAPRHPEAYGLFIGGSALDQPNERYTYFLVRGTGEYMVRVRDGAGTKTIRDWTASSAVPKADAAGKATYHLTVKVGADSVRFLVDDKPVTAVATSAVPTSGIVGLRINHNLHVATQPPTITR